MEQKEDIEKSDIEAKEVFIQKIISLSKKGEIRIPEDLIRRITEDEWDNNVESSDRIQKNKDIQRIKSIIKKEIGLEEKEINRKLDEMGVKNGYGISEAWRLFQLYIHLRDERMLDNMINSLGYNLN